MQVVEVERDELLKVIRAELSRMETQHDHSDKYWTLLLLEAALVNLYRRS